MSQFQLPFVTIFAVLLPGLAALGYSQLSQASEENFVMDTSQTMTMAAQLLPPKYVQISRKTVTVDGAAAVLTRYEPKDGRHGGLGGEHFSTVVAADGRLKGFANMAADLTGRPLPSRERSEQIARDFLQAATPDLLPRMKISWIEPHDETIRIVRDGRSEKLTLTGMKIKARNLADGRWFWVIVGSDEKPLVFERDIVWISFPGHRQTEQWLHDDWLRKQAVL